MPDWRSSLTHDPVQPLLSSGDTAIVYWANRDLLGKTGDPKSLWTLPLAKSLVKKQQTDGSWQYPGGNRKIRSSENYNQIETFRNLGYLVEMYGFDKSSPVITQAAEFLFSFQTSQGDIRGILGNQYSPYYTAGMVELLIKAGYDDDPRVHKTFAWLKSIRQNDGGWAVPLRTRGKKIDIIAMEAPTLQPDKSQPFSHLVTGIVLRAYAAHSAYCQSPEAQTAARLLLSSLFKRDAYPDRGTADFWLRFTFPFWFTDLISATDSLSKLGISKNENHIHKAVQWFTANQRADGLWQLKTLKNQKKFNTDLWISISICRVLKRLQLP
ncbi:MAG: prenyltransferase/squalene oxidase repeat-containing protein [Candidatus Saccharimonadales bacterium]